MKRLAQLLSILLLGVMLASCQKNPAGIATGGESPIGTEDAAAAATDAPAAVEGSGASSTGDFIEPATKGNEQMQFKMFIDPAPDVDPFPASVSCGDVSADVYTPTAGIWLNNHCIITAGEKRVIAVLPDGSRVYAAAGTTFQVNMDETTSEIVLTQGEVYSRVSPQSEGERFLVLAGDAALEAKGTEYGVSLKDKLINVVVIDGMVYTHRCLMWKDYTCMKWNQISSEMVAQNGYTGSIGEKDWNSTALADPAEWQNVNRLDMPLSLIEAQGGVWWFASGEDNAYFDQYNFESSVSVTEAWISGNLMEKEISYVWYDQLANQANASSAICNAFAQNCPVAEIVITETPAVPAMSGAGGGPSGKFPEFDRGSCFTRSGHLWCFPVAGSVDISMSGEWDITAICAQYPGETFCAWLK